MHLPVVDHVGYAFEAAAIQLLKRAADQAEEVEPFKLTHTQWATIYWIQGCIIVLLFAWNLYIARSIIFPFKLCAVACHEGCHALFGTLTGAKVESIILDPNQGGSTRMIGGWPFVSLPAGYIGSTLIGSALIFAGFDQKASKIAAIPLLLHLTIVSLWARKSRFTLLNTTFIIGFILALYIIQHGAFLRFLLLLIGCMNGNRLLTIQRMVQYSVWDQLDDLVFHKINESDVCAFWRLYPWIPAQVWGGIWTILSCSGLVAGVLGGIVLFKDDFAAQYFNAQTFLLYTSPWPDVELPECSVWEMVWSNPNKKGDSETAIIDGVTGETMSRSQVRSLGQRLAYGLRSTAKLSPGDVICLFSPNSILYPSIVLAAQCAGLVFSGANAAHTSDEMAHQLKDSGAKLFLVHPSTLDVALSATASLGWTSQEQEDRIFLAVKQNEAGPAGSRFGTLGTLTSDQLLEPFKVKDPKKSVAFIGYSSGTSGKAKGVKSSPYNMTSLLPMTEPLKIQDKDVVLAFLPFNHIYGLACILMTSIYHGAPLVSLPKYTLETVCAAVQRHRVTIFPLVPPVALHIARAPEVEQYDLSSLRLVSSGAAPLGPELQKELANRLPGCIVYQGFGLTETTGTTHMGFSAPAGSIGPLIPRMQARLVDPESGKDVARGEAGELWLAGPNVMLGYLNRPEANAETLVQDPQYPGTTWLRTGDIGHVDKEDNFYISDRLKELIKVKGFQVPPAELEATLLECPYVADCAVIGVWHEDEATEYPRGYVVLSAEGKKQSDAATAIHAWTKGKVAHYKQLKGGIKVVDLIPKSPSGKILRRVLRDGVKQKLEEEAKAKKARKEGEAQQAKL
ncbi:hypothetical protein JCM11251_001586 [Rhodosporidiobolus azoricus]